MSPSKDRTYAKIAELEARGFSVTTKSPAACRTMASRAKLKASGVVVPAFRSVEEVRAPSGCAYLFKVDLALDMIPLPVLAGHKCGGQADNESVAAHRRSVDASSSTAAGRAQGASSPDVLDASAVAGLRTPTLNGTAAPIASAKAAVVAAARRPPGFPDPKPADGQTMGQKQSEALPAAPKPTSSALSFYDEAITITSQTESAPAAPGTPPEAVPVPTEPSAEERTAVQSAPGVVSQGDMHSSGSNVSGVSGAGAAQQSSPPPPRTPQLQPTVQPQPAVVVMAPQPPAGEGPGHQPMPPGVAGELPTSQAPQQPRTLGLSSCPADAQRQASQAGGGSRPGSGAEQSAGVHASGCNAYAPYPAVAHQTADPRFMAYDQQRYEQQCYQQLRLEQFRQQQQLQVQQRLRQFEEFQQQQQRQQQLFLQQQQQHLQQLQQRQQLLSYQQQQQRQQHHFHLQQQAHAQQEQKQQRQGIQPGQSRPAAPAPVPPGPPAQQPFDPLRPPQRPRPCAALGKDIKRVEAALTRALTSLFRKEPRLFRDIYGFDLDWWIEARGNNTAGDAGDDLLVAMLFHNFAAVMVRVDKAAAPVWVDRPQLLNPTVSALLNEKVYGNALLLKVFKRDGMPDGGTAAEDDGSGTALQVSTLAPSQFHACVVESDNVAWQMDWYRNLVPSLAESLSRDERVLWLSRLPPTPLDEKGNPDLRRALGVVKRLFKVSIPAFRAWANGCELRRDAATMTPTPTASATMGPRGGKQLPSGRGPPRPAAAAAMAESRRGPVEANGNEEAETGLIPAEVAPLLRTLRCTSPWCTPLRPHKAGSRHSGGKSSCPFGHFWRSLDLGGRSNVMRPMFNAVRHCASKPLEPELCPSLIDRLSQIGRAVALAGMKEAANALPREPHRWSLTDLLGKGSCNVGPLKARSADGIFAPGVNTGSSGQGSEANMEDEEGKKENKKNELGEGVEEGDTTKPQTGKRQLRLEDLNFYLSFCKDGPRCRRCHSYYELNLATALQRLDGEGRSLALDAADPGQEGGRGPRCGFEVLADLSDLELHGQDGQPVVSEEEVAGSEVGQGAAATAPEPGPLPEPHETSSATVMMGIGTAFGTHGSGFNWADEPELTEPAPEAVTVLPPPPPPPPKQHPRQQHSFPWSRGHASAMLQTPLCSSGAMSLPRPPPIYGLQSTVPASPSRLPGARTGSGWGPRAPIFCFEASPVVSEASAAATTAAAVAAERALQRDLRPLPKLPDTLDLEPLPSPPGSDRATVAASLATKSRNGVYVPPHQRTPLDEDVGSDDGTPGSKVGELPAATAEGQSATAMQVQAEPAPTIMEAQAPSQASPPSQGVAALVADAASVSEPQTQLPHISAPAKPAPGGAFPSTGLGAPSAHAPSILMEASQSPNQDMEGQHRLCILRGQLQSRASTPPGFHQAQSQALPQVQEQVFPVPVPVPLPAVQQCLAQPQNEFEGGPHLTTAARSLPQHWAAPQNNPAQAAVAHAAPAGDRSGAEMENILSDCMSLCGLPLEGTPLAHQQSAAQQLSEGHLFVHDVYGSIGGSDARPAASSVALAAAPQLHMPVRPGLQAHGLPYALAHANVEQGSTVLPAAMFITTPPVHSFLQANSHQPAQWLPQHPYAQPSFVPGPFGGGGPLYGSMAAGFQQSAFQPHQQSPAPQGWALPLRACATAQGAFTHHNAYGQ